MILRTESNPDDLNSSLSNDEVDVGSLRGSCNIELDLFVQDLMDGVQMSFLRAETMVTILYLDSLILNALMAMIRLVMIYIGNPHR